MTAPIHFGRLHVLPVVIAFLDLFPEIGVRLLLNDRNVHLVGDDVDMAVRIGRLPDRSLLATRIGAVRLVAAASPEFIEKHGAPAMPDDLRSCPVVGVEGPMAETRWRFASSNGKPTSDISLRPRLAVTTTTEAAVDAAVAGVGIVRLFDYQVRGAVEAGRLKLVLEAFEPEPMPVHLVHATRGQMPLKLRRFIDFAAGRLRERLAASSVDGNRA